MSGKTAKTAGVTPARVTCRPFLPFPPDPSTRGKPLFSYGLNIFKTFALLHPVI